MPRIGLISDTHSHHRQIEPETCDLLLVAGDFSQRSTEAELEDFLVWIREWHSAATVLICGNHDRLIWRNRERFFELIRDFGIHYLEHSEVIFEGIRIWGSPLTPPVMPGLSRRFELEEQERMKVWNSIPEGVDIVMTHCPPAGLLDNAEGFSLGCQALKKRLNDVKPRYHFFGHIHQGYGVLHDGATIYANAALCDDTSQRIRNKPHYFDIFNA